MFPGDANDERVNGTLPIPRDGTGPCQGKGTGNKGEAGGVESLKNSPGKEIALSKQVRGELEKQTKVLKQVLEEKEKKRLKLLRISSVGPRKTRYGSIATPTSS